MTKQTEAIKMTIKAIEWISYKDRTLKLKCALYACKEALEQPVVMERDYNFMRDLAIGCEDALVTKDEALHKALKVLNCLNNGRIYETAWVKGAINACEEALEQPSVAELNDEYLRDTHVEGLSQPAQEPVAWEDKEDEWSDEITQSHPLKTKSYLEYDIARKMVSNRHSKGALVDLVCWLLQKASPAPSWQGNKEFVGLSDDEINYASYGNTQSDGFCDGAKWAQQALKEKNT